MANPKCASCNGTSGFHISQKEVSGTDKAYKLVACIECGAVVSVVEGWHITSALWKIMKKMGVDPNGP